MNATPRHCTALQSVASALVARRLTALSLVCRCAGMRRLEVLVVVVECFVPALCSRLLCQQRPPVPL